MAVLFDDEISVHYGFIDLTPVETPPDLGKARAGQSNGLLGAAEAGALSMVTGLHTGRVGFRLELLDSEPFLSPEWEEVVEASFTVPETAEMLLAAFEESTRIDLPTFASYRARYCAIGMDDARQAESSGEPPAGVIDRYLLQLWPAPPGPDLLVRETSTFARYWHAEAQRLPPPPPPPTPAEVAAAELAAEQEQQREQQRFHELMEMQAYGGQAASEALRTIGGRAPMVARVDLELAESVAGLPPHRQRQLAAWTARWACEFAGQADVDWVAAALAALEFEQPLPAPFDEPSQAFALMFDAPDGTVAYSGRFVSAEEVTRPPVLDSRAAALDSVLSAANSDPAAAAIEALAGALAGLDDPTQLIADARAVLDWYRRRATRARRPS